MNYIMHTLVIVFILFLVLKFGLKFDDMTALNYSLLTLVIVTFVMFITGIRKNMKESPPKKPLVPDNHLPPVPPPPFH